MSMIQIKDLSFEYDDGTKLFDCASFQLDTDWKLGFIARNGKGKTTFLKLLMGQMPYQGQIIKSVEMEYFPFEVHDTTQFTIDIMREYCPFCEDWEFYKELSLLEVKEEVLYRPFDTLSFGEETKILLAIMFLKPNSFYLIDEPTNHLDQNARLVIQNYLNTKKGFILVSHDRKLLDACVDHVLVIQNEKIEVQQGNYSSWYCNKKQNDQYELVENEKLQKQIQHLQQAAKQTTKWANIVEKSKNGQRNSGSKVDKGYVGHKSAKMMKRAKTQEKRYQEMINQKSSLLKNIDEIESLKIHCLTYAKNPYVQVQDLSLYYDGVMIIQKLSFTLNGKERLLIQGINGSGKTTLLKFLYEQNISHTGEYRIGSDLIISYVSQDISHLEGSLSDYAKECQVDESLMMAILRKLGFSREQFEKPMQDYSAGQKKKVLLARSLSQPAHLYIWDEPLNYLDVYARIQIEELLQQYEPTMIFVEHDETFQKAIATREIVLS